jgi:hypothetical protein
MGTQKKTMLMKKEYKIKEVHIVKLDLLLKKVEKTIKPDKNVTDNQRRLNSK